MLTKPLLHYLYLKNYHEENKEMVQSKVHTANQVLENTQTYNKERKIEVTRGSVQTEMGTKEGLTNSREN